MVEFYPDANRARRAQGAMFLFAFGGAWLGSYIVQLVGKHPVPLLVTALATVALIGFAYRRYKRNFPALATQAPAAAMVRAKRMFNIVNAAQWVIICLACSVLVSRGLASWIIPCVILIVGLHLLPLAYFFENRAHYLTGAALIALAAVYPLLSSSGPKSPVGSLGAGLILWASGFWAVTANNFVRSLPSTLGE